MATFRASNHGLANAQAFSFGAYGHNVVPFTFALTGAMASGDILILCKIPIGATVCNAYISSPTLDATATWGVGDSGSATRFVSAGTGPNGAVNTMLHSLNGFVAQSLTRKYTAADDFRITISGSVTSFATTGTIKGYVEYSMVDF